MSCTATTTLVPAESPSEPEPVVQELISAVKELQVQQKAVVAALSAERPYCQELSKEATVSTFWRTTEAGATPPCKMLSLRRIWPLSFPMCQQLD
eukprot:gene19774-21709_t